MICNKCGTPNPDDALFCSSCGAKIEATAAPNTAYTAPSYPTYATPEAYNQSGVQLLGDETKNWAGITSLVCGIVSVACCVLGPVGLIAAILAVIFGIIGIKSNKKTLAIVGLCLGCLGVLLCVYMTICYVIVIYYPELAQQITGNSELYSSLKKY